MTCLPKSKRREVRLWTGSCPGSGQTCASFSQFSFSPKLNWDVQPKIEVFVIGVTERENKGNLGVLKQIKNLNKTLIFDDAPRITLLKGF
jgi:hypothetical protein